MAKIPIDDKKAGYTDTSFDFVFSIFLSDFLSDALHETKLHAPKKTTVSQENTVLAAALFSGSVIQHGLLDSSHIYAFTSQGLQLPDSYFERERQEIVAIGACLQLLVAGQKLIEGIVPEDGQDKVTPALERLKKKEIINYPKGIELLEVNFFYTSR